MSNKSKITPLRLSKHFLIGLYLFPILALLTVLIDQFRFQGELRAILPDSPYRIYLLNLIFAEPHIIASIFSFADRDYIRFYARDLKRSLPALCLLVLIVHFFLPKTVAFVFYAGYTVYHVLAQQAGIGLLMHGVFDRDYRIWRLSFILSGFLLYLRIFERYHNLFYVQAGGFTLREWSDLLFGALAFLFTIYTFKLTTTSKTRSGVVYLWANYLLIATTWFFVQTGYIFFAALVPRAIHDVSAWGFYISHDYNRNRPAAANYIYKIFRVSGLSAVLLLPVLALVGSYFINHYMALGIVLYLQFFMSYFHYYFESLMWKREAIHRRQIYV